MTLRELLWLSPLKLDVMPPEFNIRHKRYLYFWKKNEAEPKILHLAEFHDFDRSYFSSAKRRLKEIRKDARSGFSVLGSAMRKVLRLLLGRR